MLQIQHFLLPGVTRPGEAPNQGDRGLNKRLFDETRSPQFEDSISGRILEVYRAEIEGDF
jgi:hypothetical protein